MPLQSAASDICDDANRPLIKEDLPVTGVVLAASNRSIQRFAMYFRQSLPQMLSLHLINDLDGVLMRLWCQKPDLFQIVSAQHFWQPEVVDHPLRFGHTQIDQESKVSHLCQNSDFEPVAFGRC